MRADLLLALLPALFAVFIGLIWGSFLNVVIYRFPQTAAAGLRARGESTLFLAWPSSFCPRCKSSIPLWRNIPLLSFLLQRGRCASCGASIGWRYPLVEACGGLIFLLCGARFGVSADGFLAVLFLSLLLCLAMIDFRKLFLPDAMTLSLLWLGLVANLDSRFAPLPDAVIGAAAGYVGLRLFAETTTWILRRPAMGGGDWKLLAAIGAWLGWEALPLVVFLGGATAAIFGFWRRLRGRGKKRRILPFGPFLAAGGAIALFYGDDLLSAYFRFLGR